MRFWRNLRTAFQLADRVEDLEQQWTDVRMEVADQLDKLDRLLRRLTLRAQRSDAREETTMPAIVSQPTTSNHKNELRAIAREKGLIR